MSQPACPAITGCQSGALGATTRRPARHGPYPRCLPRRRRKKPTAKQNRKEGTSPRRALLTPGAKCSLTLPRTEGHLRTRTPAPQTRRPTARHLPPCSCSSAHAAAPPSCTSPPRRLRSAARPACVRGGGKRGCTPRSVAAWVVGCFCWAADRRLSLPSAPASSWFRRILRAVWH